MHKQKKLKMKPGPDRTGKKETKTGFVLKPAPDRPEKIEPGLEGTTRTGKNKTQTRTGPDRNIPGVYELGIENCGK